MVNKAKIFFTFYFLLFTFYFFYSYAFLDHALTLTSFNPYLEMQKRMRLWGYFHRPQSTIIFVVFTLLLLTGYLGLLALFKKSKISFKKIISLSLIISLLLVFAYPSFSHDIFNYIFNAKMVLIYKANPHFKVAAQFSDPMLGFMRNIHTPAPYFYGWTLISLMPFLLGFNRIFPELISFKFFSVFFFWLTFMLLNKIYSIFKIKNDRLRLTLFLLNPLILIEAIGIGHNDLAMMLGVLLGFYFLIKYKNKKKFYFLLFAILCLLFSISIKYATIVLIPLFIIWYFKPQFDLGLWGAILLFLLPFVRPLDQLHSWYLLWPLTWILLSKNSKAISFFFLLSFFSLLRYAPYIYYGNWDPPVPLLRLLIYFSVPFVVLLFNLIRLLKKNFFIRLY